MQITPLSPRAASEALDKLRRLRPLVHCLTNDVVQEITANVLLAAGASPAMVVAEEEAPYFAGIAGALLVNVGTPVPERLKSMQLSAQAAREKHVPWVLDPVAAGVIPWRDGEIRKLIALHPTVIRGNASEILALAGAGKGDSSSSAVNAAVELARSTGSVVCVTGETDYATDGERVLSVSGGNVMTTLVVGTGCSLSALTAAFCAAEKDPVTAAVSACALAKRAAFIAGKNSKGPGSFHDEYLDALYSIQPQDFLGESL